MTAVQSQRIRGSQGSIRLDVPFYRQRFDFTCGPASLMMAMKYFDKSIKLSKDLEMDIWREANMVESYGTSGYGLAFAAGQRGFRARVYSNIEGYGFLNKLRPPIEGMNRKMLKLFFEERTERCRKLGVGIRKGAITLDMLRKSLASEAVPLLLSSTSHFSKEKERDDLPHWIVITGLDAQRLYVNNPLAIKAKEGRVSVDLSSFPGILGFKGDECMVEVWH